MIIIILTIKMLYRYGHRRRDRSPGQPMYRFSLRRSCAFHGVFENITFTAINSRVGLSKVRYRRSNIIYTDSTTTNHPSPPKQHPHPHQSSPPRIQQPVDLYYNMILYTVIGGEKYIITIYYNSSRGVFHSGVSIRGHTLILYYDDYYY